jgi:hypothetical protein
LGFVGLGFGGVRHRIVRYVMRRMEAAREKAIGSGDVMAVMKDISTEILVFWKIDMGASCLKAYRL